MIGRQFQSAIGRYYEFQAGGKKDYPATLEDLLRDARVPHRVESDRLGHRILALELDSMPALAQKTVQIRTVSEMARQQGARVASIDPADWLAEERHIESTAAPVRALAAQLKRGSDLATAGAIYDWLQANIVYAGYLADDLGALRGLLGLRGDCTEYADLAVALARASGVPARMVGGYVAESDLAPRPQDYHNWAELHVDGAWLVLDAQKGNVLAHPERYIVYRIYRDVATNPVGLAHRYRLDGQMQVTF